MCTREKAIPAETVKSSVKLFWKYWTCTHTLLTNRKRPKRPSSILCFSFWRHGGNANKVLNELKGTLPHVSGFLFCCNFWTCSILGFQLIYACDYSAVVTIDRRMKRVFILSANNLLWLSETTWTPFAFQWRKGPVRPCLKIDCYLPWMICVWIVKDGWILRAYVLWMNSAWRLIYYFRSISPWLIRIFSCSNDRQGCWERTADFRSIR